LQQALASIPDNVDEVIIAGTGFLLEDYDLPKAADVQSVNIPLGLTETINTVVDKYVTGDFLSILPDDDFYTEHINKIVDRLPDSPAEVIYFPSRHFIGDAAQAGLFDNDPDITFEKNIKANGVTGSAFIRKAAWDYLEGYKGKICMDWDLWNRALKSEFLFEYVNLPGINFRFNDHSRLQKMARNMAAGEIQGFIRKSAAARDKRILFRCSVGGGL
jgi:hypothetical protein